MQRRFILVLLALSACRTGSSSVPEDTSDQVIPVATLCPDGSIGVPSTTTEGATGKFGLQPKESVPNSGQVKPAFSEDVRPLVDEQVKVYDNPKSHIICPEQLEAAQKLVDPTAGLVDKPTVNVFTPYDPAKPPTVDTRPLYIADPVLAKNGAEGGFGCYGACGPSCECAGKVTNTISRDEDVNGVAMACDYEVTNCFTHAFCRWHDSCYLACDFSHATNSFLRSLCYRSCDSGCLTGKSPSPIISNWPDQAQDIKVPDAPFSPLSCKRFATNDNTKYYQDRITFTRRLQCHPKNSAVVIPAN